MSKILRNGPWEVQDYSLLKNYLMVYIVLIKIILNCIVPEACFCILSHLTKINTWKDHLGLNCNSSWKSEQLKTPGRRPQGCQSPHGILLQLWTWKTFTVALSFLYFSSLPDPSPRPTPHFNPWVTALSYQE